MKFLIWFYILLPQYLMAQLKTIKVIDSNTRMPVQFCHVSIGSKRATYADYVGVLQVKVENSDTITFQNLGYEMLVMTGSDFLKSDTIFLKPKLNLLNEIDIIPFSTKSIPYVTRKPEYWFSSRNNFEVATYVPLEKIGTYKKVETIKLRFMKGSRKHNSCKLHIYEVSNDGMPGKEVLDKNIILTYQSIRSKEVTINLEHYNVGTFAAGLFVGVEWVGTIQESKLRGPYVGMTHDVNEVRTFTRRYLKDQWVNLQVKLPGRKNTPNMLVSVKYK